MRITGNSKKEIATKIAKMFKGYISPKQAANYVRKGFVNGQKEININPPANFRLRKANGQYRKTPKKF